MSKLGSVLVVVGIAVLLAVSVGAVLAADEPSPLPLHSVEGAGGVFSTLTAYIVNPPAKGETWGKPSVGAIYVDLQNGRNLKVLTLTEAVTDRIELGYAGSRLDLGDLPGAIQGATGIRIDNKAVQLQQFNVRALLVKESAKVPAVTFGVHYKHNQDTEAIDRDLLGTLHAIGVTNNSGVDYTLYASKCFTQLIPQHPVIVSAGLRSTQAAHTGLLGFTEDRSTVLEGSVIVFATSKLLFAAEYKQKPDNYQAIPGLVGAEDDWWTVDAAYILSPRTTIAAGFAHFGEVLNHKANRSWGVAVKHEF